MLQNFLIVSDHFTTLRSEGLGMGPSAPGGGGGGYWPLNDQCLSHIEIS